MERIKNFINNHKKIVVPVIAVIALLLAGGGILVSAAFTDVNDRGSKQAAQEKEAQNKTTEVPEDQTEKKATIKDQTEKTGADSKNEEKETADSSDAETKDKDDKTDKTDQQQSDEKKNESSASAKTAASSVKNSSISSTGSYSTEKSESTSASKSAHTHRWADHTAKKQVWVSKMVTVDDYETKTIYGARFYIPTGEGSFIAKGPTYWFENGFTQEDLKTVIYNALKNADSDGLYNGVYYGNYQNVTKTEQVKTGSHQEDQGHYVTQTYVDYQYCTVCGQKK